MLFLREIADTPTEAHDEINVQAHGTGMRRVVHCWPGSVASVLTRRFVAEKKKHRHNYKHQACLSRFSGQAQDLSRAHICVCFQFLSLEFYVKITRRTKPDSSSSQVVLRF